MFNKPTIDYVAVAPILIVLGAALIGVLIEAFVERSKRYLSHLITALVGLVAAFAWIIKIHATKLVTAEGSVTIDGPTLVIQASVVLLGILGVLLIAERSLDSAGGAFVAQASALPGSEAEKAAIAAKLTQTEVFPLTLFAIGGMMLFPASNDLVTMFVALEVLSLPLYLMSGLARRRRLLSRNQHLSTSC